MTRAIETVSIPTAAVALRRARLSEKVARSCSPSAVRHPPEAPAEEPVRTAAGAGFSNCRKASGSVTAVTGDSIRIREVRRTAAATV